MAETPHTVLLRLQGHESEARLPSLLGGAQRSGADAEPDPFLPAGYLKPVATLEVGVPRRGETEVETLARSAAAGEVVVLELADGAVLVTSAGRLHASLARSQPSAVGDDGSVLLDRLGSGGEARSIAGGIASLVQRVYTMVAGSDAGDAIVRTALEKVADPLLLGVSWAGTRALMAAVEHQVDERVGRTSGRLYQWDGRDRFADAQPAGQRPLLVFVHGTASSTQGSFGDLRESDPALWTELERRFDGGIYGFEHRTLSCSPIDNAIELATALPAGAEVCLVTHSRGGLVGDLLCLDADDATLAAAIEAYRYRLPRTGEDDPAEDDRVRAEIDAAHAEQRGRLQELQRLLAQRRINVRRYVRVASPARGTLLAGANFDLFLSGLLSLVGQIPVLRTSLLYSAFKRVVIEIAKRRTNPHVVPGIEAMLPDSPLATLLRTAPVRATEMALIAGDIEGGGLLKRLGVFLTDTLIFENENHDLVVDTAAMLAGVAPRAGARLLFDQGAAVSHFRYFTNPRTRQALGHWLLKGPQDAPFTALPAPGEDPVYVPPASRGVEDDERPVVIVLPGVMGSNLKIGDDVVWVDAIDLFRGGLGRLQWREPTDVEPAGLFRKFYGALCDRLAATHHVVPFAYDWRQPLDVLGGRLRDLLADLLPKTGNRPIRLLAHSMGGLVVRAALHLDARLMDAVLSRPGARLVMCGTPHQGSHSMVENLIGKGDLLRKLVLLDTRHDLQEVLDIVAGFRGALSLLPKPGFVDTFQGDQDQGGEFFDWQSPSTWRDLKARVFDFWFGDGRVGQPDEPALKAASWLWQQDGSGRPQLPEQHRAKAIYVAGVARNTPCGVRRDARGRLKLVGTTRGDGTVTWDSGRIDGIGSFYYMPATEHGSLLSTAAYFDALIDLLVEGRSTRLPTTAPAVRALDADGPVLYDAAPPTVDDPAVLARLAMGANSDGGLPPVARQTLEVGVCAMDLRFAEAVVMAGHYQDDAVAGPEAVIDTELLEGQLGERHELGLYAGPVGTAVAVLQQPGPSGKRRGAVVTGLGRYDGTLTPSRLTEAVRTGALRHLLHAQDVLRPGEPVPALAALLLGYNSSTHISVAASVEALVRGVIEANARFQQARRRPGGVERLDIVELFRDTAISAVYALRQLGPQLRDYAAQQGITLVIRGDLEQRDGVRERLQDRAGSNYWPRLIIAGAGTDRLNFLFVGERARAEATQQRRQPGQVEAIVRSQIRQNRWQPDLGRALFQLTVPNEFKESIRGVGQAVFVVDERTANLPWELMLADDPARGQEEARPLALRLRLLRQFQTDRFRRSVRQSVGRSALVIGNPSVEGFELAFPAPAGKPARKPPPDLPGAEREAGTVADLMLRAGYEVDRCIGPDRSHADVVVRLHRRPWRLLHVSAHGVYQEVHRDGDERSGVVLSDGFLLTAAEIRAMEVVPELVVLNCCHLGRMDEREHAPIGDKANLLAASVARELIDGGVRCVVVAGWAVTDALAQRFGERFYAELLVNGSSFGEAVHQARRAVWDADASDITWGAFQAYGDPDWRAERPADGGTRDDQPCASPDEVLDALARLRVEFVRRASNFTAPERQRQVARVNAVMGTRCRAEWRTRVDVQSALGATWQALTEFDAARKAYLAAVAGAGPKLATSTRDVEMLANVEAKLAEETGDLALADLALSRLRDLESALGGPYDGGAGTVERQSLLGSAWKVKAALIARRPEAGRDVAALVHALEASAAAYGAVTRPVGAPGFDAYPALNALWLGLCLGRWPGLTRAQATAQADAIAEHVAARSRQDVNDIWLQIMVPESLLVAALVGRRMRSDEAQVQQAYDALLGATLLKRTHLESLTGHLRKMAVLLEAMAPTRRGPAAVAEARNAASRLRALLARLGA